MAVKDKEEETPQNSAKTVENSTKFKLGERVEVSSDDEGFRGAWYVATILKSISASRKRKAKVYVQYSTLVSDSDENKPLTESVDASFVRPLPPVPDSDQSYEPFDVVDAFHRDGWWKGVVTKVDVLEDNKSSYKSYTVIFENPPEQIQFQPKDLRLHLEWINGTWVRLPKQKRMEGLKFIKGMTVEVNFNKENSEDAWFPAAILEEVGFNSFVVEWGSSSNNGENARLKETVDSFHIRRPPPKLDVTDYEMLERVDVFHDSSWRDAFITKILTEGRYSVVIKDMNKEIQLSHAEMRPHLLLTDGAWVNFDRDISITVQFEEQSVDSVIAGSVERSGTVINDSVKSSRGKLGIAKDQQREKLPFKRLRNNSSEQSTPCNSNSPSERVLESEETLSCFSKKLRKVNSLKLSSLRACDVELTPVKTTEQEIQVADGVLTKCSTCDLVNDLPSSGFYSPLREQNVDSNGKDGGLENEATASLEKRGQIDFQIKYEWAPAADALIETSPIISSKNHVANEAIMAAEGEHSNGQALSTRLSGIRESNVESIVQSSAIDAPGGIELVESEQMPFVKRSSIWETIESMEVFKMLPQKPHFSPLIEQKEASREGFAVGYMLTFSNLIEKTSNLQVDDSREVFDSCLEVLGDLELHGFDVKAVVDRLNRLLSIKERREQLENRSKNVHSQMADRKHEKTKLEEEVGTIDRMISDLEEQRALKVSVMVTKDSEISTLQVDADVIDTDIVDAKYEFQSLAATPLARDAFL